MESHSSSSNVDVDAVGRPHSSGVFRSPYARSPRAATSSPPPRLGGSLSKGDSSPRPAGKFDKKAFLASMGPRDPQLDAISLSQDRHTGPSRFARDYSDWQMGRATFPFPAPPESLQTPASASAPEPPGPKASAPEMPATSATPEAASAPGPATTTAEQHNIASPSDTLRQTESSEGIPLAEDYGAFVAHVNASFNKVNRQLHDFYRDA